MLIMFYSLL